MCVTPVLSMVDLRRPLVGIKGYAIVISVCFCKQTPAKTLLTHKTQQVISQRFSATTAVVLLPNSDNKLEHQLTHSEGVSRQIHMCEYYKKEIVQRASHDIAGYAVSKHNIFHLTSPQLAEQPV